MRRRGVIVIALAGLVTACGGGGGAGGPGGASGSAGGGGGAGGTTAGPRSPHRFLLRLEAPPPPVTLDLDRKTALELFGDQGARQIVVLRVDPTHLLENTLALIQGACGSGFQLDSPDPAYDCQATALGQSFGPGWATSPEFALVRLLGMTPANAGVQGTSLADLSDLFAQNAKLFAVDFAQVLGESLGIARTSPVVPGAALVAALTQQLLGTHPAVRDPAGRLPVTLHDALNDLTPLASELGPVGSPPYEQPGEHPGILVPDDATFVTRSDALTAGFRLQITATSNLRLVQGVDLARGAGELFVMDGTAPLAFDFEDPAKFVVTGLRDAPTLDFRFSLHEEPAVVAACTGDPACKTNLPPPLGAPVGAGSVWAVPPYLFQSLVARAGLDAYGSHVFDRCYLTLNQACLVGIGIGGPGDPPGWTVFTNQIQGLTVPAPQYLWELLDEVAQVAAHDPAGHGTPELPLGEAPVYRLRGVPIGLSGQDLVAAMRPSLQGQADAIAELVAGGYWRRSDALDFYYRRPPEGGAPYLYFVGPHDLRPDPKHPGVPAPFAYSRPGFFSRPDLAAGSKVSSTAVPGLADTEHEKYRLPVGSTVLYVEDDEGGVYELRFAVPSDRLELSVETKKL